MRLSALAALLVVLSAAGPLPAADQATDVARLVGRLGSSSFAERQEAARALDAVGGPALPALRTAQRGPDPEVRRRARDLVRRIEQREEMARVLRPQTVRLVYKDTPLREALADFSRKAGARIQLRGGAARERRVTLDTGEATYWEALARFCAAAGLHEAERPVVGLPGEEAFARGGGGRRILFLDRGGRIAQAPEGPVWLEEGAPHPVPTCQLGALRVRLPPGARGQATEARGNLPLTLEAHLEPRFEWESLALLYVDRALDDRGRELPRPAPYIGGVTDPRQLIEEVILVTDGKMGLPTDQGPRQVTLPLRLGDRPCPRLRELRGSVVAWVRAPVGPLVEVSAALKAKGRSVRGRDGTVLKVNNVELKGEDLCWLQVTVTPPAPVSDLIPLGARVRWIDRRSRGRGRLSPKDADQPFALFDADGRPLTLAAGEHVMNNDGLTRSYTLTFRPGANGAQVGAAARLVYKGRRTVFIEVPFVFKDVALSQADPRK